MKRFFPLFLALVGCFVLAGCPNEENGDGGGDGNPTTDAGPANDGTGPTAQFPQGVGSGRAEDGSDEDK